MVRAKKSSVDLRVLVKENELELAKGPNPLTMVTLRGSTGSTRLTRSPVVKDGEPTLTQETRQVEEMGSMVWQAASKKVISSS